MVPEGQELGRSNIGQREDSHSDWIELGNRAGARGGTADARYGLILSHSHPL